MSCVCNFLVKKDCALIMDAVRRLREGLWDLKEEDLLVAHHLLPQIKAALKDHIELEEELVFPQLCESERAAHTQEHAELDSVLWALELSLKERAPDALRSLLDVLSDLLERHHQGSWPEHSPRAREVLKQDLTRRLFARGQQPTLEPVWKL